ncbi:uncharacterized protein [Dermacentor albipictus]|uniref:uncharacterized protein isoform X3 n=1 Tax=Dermacentor albipictus TaxID=60249 RepID=UPI0038FCBE0E
MILEASWILRYFWCVEDARSSKDQPLLTQIKGTMPTFPTLSACMGHWDCWQASVAMLAARGLTRLLLYFWASEIYRERHPGTPQTAEAIYGWCCRIVANADPLASTALASLPVLGPYEYAETHAVLAAIVMVVTLCVLAAAAYLKVMVEKDDGTTRPPFPTVSSCLAHWGTREAWVAALVARGLTRLLLYFWASEIYRLQQPGIPEPAQHIDG